MLQYFVSRWDVSAFERFRPDPSASMKISSWSFLGSLKCLVSSRTKERPSRTFGEIFDAAICCA